MDKTVIREMRKWIEDCGEAADVAQRPLDWEIALTVEMVYSGGIKQFIIDGFSETPNDGMPKTGRLA